MESPSTCRDLPFASFLCSPLCLLFSFLKWKEREGKGKANSMDYAINISKVLQQKSAINIWWIRYSTGRLLSLGSQNNMFLENPRSISSTAIIQACFPAASYSQRLQGWGWKSVVMRIYVPEVVHVDPIPGPLPPNVTPLYLSQVVAVIQACPRTIWSIHCEY